MNETWWGRFRRFVVTLAGLLFAWQLLVWITGVPSFILPSPPIVMLTLVEERWLILSHVWVTAFEIVMGLVLGVALGCLSAMGLASSMAARRWLLPVLIASQALPVFALAPILVLWFGYGLGSKIAMAVLIIYFPVTAAFFDGLRRVEPGLRDLAQLAGATRGQFLLWIAVPSALPALASGLRVAAAAAPIGAVVGEWVGASQGLGFLMLHANRRMQTDLTFAALLVLMVLALLIYGAVDRLARRLTPWLNEQSIDPR
ncbi:MAG: ABC transporter permease [Geminicoccaceae bacterium]